MYNSKYDLIGVKLGGADITKKVDAFSFPWNIINIMSQGFDYIDIKKLNDIVNLINRERSEQKRFVIVHGAGPFGHELAYNIDARLVHLSMEYLNLVVRAVFEKVKLEVEAVSPFDHCTVIEGENRFDMKSLVDKVVEILDREVIPISFGDMACKKDDTGYSVISGDNILPAIGYDTRIKMRQMVMLSKHQLHDENPEVEGAKKISKIEVDIESVENRLKKMEIEIPPNPNDKSGGMLGKVKECYYFTQKTRVPSVIVKFEDISSLPVDESVGTHFISI